MKGLYLMTSLLGTHSRACEHSSSQHQVLTLLAGGSARHHSPALCVQQALDDQFQKTDCPGTVCRREHALRQMH